MENSITVNVTPLQMLLTVAFQLWIVIFPIILIRKLNYLIALMHEQFDSGKESQGV